MIGEQKSSLHWESRHFHDYAFKRNCRMHEGPLSYRPGWPMVAN